eukprot:6476879-Prymnesium_polylepis.1
MTSCAAMPPKTAHIGESSPRAPDARLRMRRSENSTSSPAALAIACARSSTSLAAAPSDGGGIAPPWSAAYACSAWKPWCSCDGRSNLAKSEMR